MARIVQIAEGISVNPEHVTTVRGDIYEFYVEMMTGTRHTLSGSMIGVIRRLNGEDDESSR